MAELGPMPPRSYPYPVPPQPHPPLTKTHKALLRHFAANGDVGHIYSGRRVLYLGSMRSVTLEREAPYASCNVAVIDTLEHYDRIRHAGFRGPFRINRENAQVAAFLEKEGL